jgi:hypothetical protein
VPRAINAILLQSGFDGTQNIKKKKRKNITKGSKLNILSA